MRLLANRRSQLSSNLTKSASSSLGDFIPKDFYRSDRQVLVFLALSPADTGTLSRPRQRLPASTIGELQTTHSKLDGDPLGILNQSQTSTG